MQLQISVDSPLQNPGAKNALLALCSGCFSANFERLDLKNRQLPA